MSRKFGRSSTLTANSTLSTIPTVTSRNDVGDHFAEQDCLQSHKDMLLRELCDVSVKQEELKQILSAGQIELDRLPSLQRNIC